MTIQRASASLSTAQHSLDAAIEKCQKDAAEYRDDFLVGQSGLTGICAGFACECFDWVEQHGNREPFPLIPTHPSETAKHLEKLLVLSIAQNQPRERAPHTVTRGTPENDQLIGKMSQAFYRLLASECNVKIVQTYPKMAREDFSKHISLSRGKRVDWLLDQIFKENTKKGSHHYLFFFHQKRQQITEGHVIYVNPKRGIIGDAGPGCLMWKVDAASQPQFRAILKGHLNKHYKSQNLFVCKVEKNTPSFYSQMPLLLRRAVARTQTAATIAIRFGLKEAAEYCHSLHASNSLITILFPRKEPFLESLSNLNYDAFKDLEDLKKLEALCLRHSRILSQLTREDLIKISYKCLTLISKCIGKGEKMEQLLKILQGFDPKVEVVTAYLQELFFSELFQAHPSRYKDWAICEPIVLKLLEMREKLQKKYSLDAGVYNIVNHWPEKERMLPAILAAGGEAEGPKSIDNEKWHAFSPLTDACKKGRFEAAKILVRGGANPQHPKYAKGTSPLSYLDEAQRKELLQLFKART